MVNQWLTSDSSAPDYQHKYMHKPNQDSGSSIHGAAADQADAAEQGAKVTYVHAAEGDAGQRIDNFLMRTIKDVPRSLVYRILRSGEVRVNSGRVKPDYRLVDGDRIRVPPVKVKPREPAGVPSRSLRDLIAGSIIHEDRDLLVLNKPSGVSVHGGSGVSTGVIETLRILRPELKELELVHRLDRDTSGCLLVAKRRAALRNLHAQLRERQMDKHYLALLGGRWPFGTKTIELPLKTNLKQGGERIVRVHEDGQDAITYFKPIEQFAKIATLMDVSIGTGRTHQIRVHAAHCGHAVAGDEKYGDREVDAKLKEFGLRRMFLHAHTLSFARPDSEGEFTVTAPLPEELESVLEQLRAAS